MFAASSLKLALASIVPWHCHMSVSRETFSLYLTALAPGFQNKTTKTSRRGQCSAVVHIVFLHAE